MLLHKLKGNLDMVNIALCDDDKEILLEINRHILTFMENASVSAATKTFTSGEVLAASVSDGDRFDIYILDVEMSDMDGFAVAKKVRQYQPNAIVIFLTLHPEQARDGYKVNALRYIAKLELAEALPEALEEALEALKQADKQCLLIQHYNNFTRVLYQDIMYVRKSRRCVLITTTRQGNIQDNRGLKELFEQIDDPRFTFTERSCFINLDYARGIDGYWMVLKNGERLPISRPMLPKVKEAIINLWGR